MTNLDSILKSRDITLPTKVCLVKAMVFPVVMYGCESWTVTPVDGEGQGSLACCSPWIAKSQTRLSNNNKGEAPSIKTDVNSPCVYLLTLIVSMYFLPSFTGTPCLAKSFMPEACGHIPYRAVMVWICCFCGQNLDLLVGVFSLSLV